MFSSFSFTDLEEEMKVARTVFLLLLLFATTMDARRKDGGRRRSYNYGENDCTPCQEYQLRFKERTTTDYAILEDSIVYDLDAATVCFFAKDRDSNKPPNEYQCVYSYAVSDHNNELLFCTSPVLRVLVDGVGTYLTCIEAMLSVS